MKKILITGLILMNFYLAAAQPTTNMVWLNEFHYDGLSNYGQSDQNEFVEFAVHNSIANNASELAKLKLVLYTAGSIENGAPTLAKGKPYDSTGPLYTTAETVHNFGTGGFTKCAITGTDFTLISKTLSVLQDIPTGLAIVYNDNVIVQLLSYEKPFKIVAAGNGGGAAAGNTTTVIMVAPGDTAMENALTPVNHSIGLMGNGIAYQNFSWRDDAAMVATPCAPNMDIVGTTQLLSGGPLPSAMTFSLRTDNRDIFLSWKSAAEEPGSTFTVESAPGNSSNFATITTQPGRATASGSSLDYNYVINNAQPGIYNFRIKQVDLNGRAQYSQILKAFVKTEYGHVLSSVYPNPASAKATFTLSVDKIQNVVIELFNSSGEKVRSVYNGTVSANSTSLYHFDTRDIANGKYYILVQGENFKDIKPVVVAH